MTTRTPIFLLVLIGSLLTLTVSCIEKYVPKDGEIEMYVDLPIGTEFQYRDKIEERNFLPHITNEGTATFENRKSRISLIGKKMNTGDELFVMLIAKLQYQRQGQRSEIIIAIPAEKKYRIIEITSYESLITEYFSTKQMIEYWYANRYGLGGVTDIIWSSL
tara:strand:- start:1155 stop:1640 length:486 start_codon:yes stop_codon:yes gene_type:complete